MTGSNHYGEQLARMRLAFDRDFESVRASAVEETEPYVVVRVGGERVALRVAALSSIEVGARVMPVPLDLPVLMGLAGVRSVLVPVYRLATLIGVATSGETQQVIAVCRAPSPVGLALDGLVGQVEAPRSARQPAGPAARKHVAELLQTEDGFQPIVDVSSVILELERLASGRRAASGSNQRED